MQRIAKKAIEADKWIGPLCPNIQKKLETSIPMSASNIRPSSQASSSKLHQHACTNSAPTQQARTTTTTAPHHQQATTQTPLARIPKMTVNKRSSNGTWKQPAPARSAPTLQDKTTTSAPAQQGLTQQSPIQEIYSNLLKETTIPSPFVEIWATKKPSVRII
ncbi:hypothetical protein V6N13_149053 [Hibiscus sabdariffa]